MVHSCQLNPMLTDGTTPHVTFINKWTGSMGQRCPNTWRLWKYKSQFDQLLIPQPVLPQQLHVQRSEEPGDAEGIRRAATWKSHTNIGQALHDSRSFLVSVKLHLLPIPTIFSQAHKLIINPGAESSSQVHFLWCCKSHLSIHKNFSGHSVRLVLKSFTINCRERAWPSLHILHCTWERGHGVQEWTSFIHPKMSS